VRIFNDRGFILKSYFDSDSFYYDLYGMSCNLTRLNLMCLDAFDALKLPNMKQ